MKLDRLIIAIAAACTLSSCGIYNSYKRPDDIKTQGLTGDEQLQVSQDSALNWREFFTDPALCKLIEQGLQNNSNIRSAKLQLDAAQASLTASKLAFLPTFAFTPSGTLSQFDNYDMTKTYSIPVTASWQIDAFGSLRNSKKIAEVSVEQAKVYRQAVQSQIVAAIANYYYTLLLLDKELKVCEETEQNWGESVRTYHALMDAGMSNDAAVSAAEANYQTVKVNVETFKQSIKNTEQALCAVLGDTPHHIDRKEWNPETLDVTNFAGNGVPLSMLEQRPDVKSAELSLASAFYATNAARSAFYPSITLSGSIGWTNNAGSMIVNPGKLLWSAMAQLVQPIFQGGKIRAQYKISQAQQEQAKINFQQTLLDAGVEVNNALTQIQTAKSKQGLYKAQREALERNVSSTELLMEHGNTTYLEVLNAKTSLLQAQLSELSNSHDELAAYIQLYNALGGGGYVEEPAEANAEQK